MLRGTITLLEDFEEELGSEKIGNTNELRTLGNDFKKKLDTVSGLLDLLEKHGWTWTTGARDITLYKNSTKKDAEKELATLHVPEGIISFD